MSHTVPVYSDDVDRKVTNVLNEVRRHCRIGKVVRKAKQPLGLQDILTPQPLKSLMMWPFDGGTPAPSPQYMNKCGCKVGSVCNNVACPHRLVVTC